MLQPTIFISHSTHDNDTTRLIADLLRQSDFDVWVDFDSIQDGQRWLREIQAGIDKCDAVLVLLSRASRQSEWVERECLYSFDLKKPVFIALIEDVPLPLHLINIQFTDCRTDIDNSIADLIETLDKTLKSHRQLSNHIMDDASAEPTEDNFFPYVEQLPQGTAAMLVAKDLYFWAGQVADEIEFGGKYRPAYHVKIDIRDESVTIFSIWAYPKTPSTQIPLDYLAGYPPYNKKALRVSLLKKLNQLMPDGIQFDEGKIERRPTMPLHYLSTAEKLESFKQIIADIINNLRSG